MRSYASTITLICSAIACSIASSADETPKRRFITADSSKGRLAIIDAAGKTEWETKIGPLHDFQVLPTGRILYQKNWTHLVEIDPKTNEIAWEYDSAKLNGNEGKRIEVHAFERYADGTTMIAESGAARIIEVDRNGKLLAEIPLRVPSPSAHHDTRLVRKTPSGTYLVCHETQGKVCEYERSGKIVWEYEIPLFDRKPAGGHGVEAFGNHCFSALRLANGNTLIGTGNGHSVLEVTPEKKIVWSVHQNDLPDIQLAWVTTLQVLPSGNIVIGNCHAGEKNPQIVEVNRDKKVVWSFRDFERFGNSTTNTFVLTVDGKDVE